MSCGKFFSLGCLVLPPEPDELGDGEQEYDVSDDGEEPFASRGQRQPARQQQGDGAEDPEYISTYYQRSRPGIDRAAHYID